MEGILNSKIQGRKLWYIVDWKGYGPEKRTQEPKENFTNAAKAVAAYHLQYSQCPSLVDLLSQLQGTSVGKRGGTIINAAVPAPSR